MMFQFNLNDYTSHYYPSVQEAYSDYLKRFVTKGDYEYYKDCCGVNLNDVTDPKIMKCIFNNVFERVIFSSEIDRIIINEEED